MSYLHAGFFRSIALSSGNSLQDTLRLLTLWFKYGYDSNVDHAMTEGFGDVSIDTWLQVIPQVRPSVYQRCCTVARSMLMLRVSDF